ncbi:telomere repeat-binding protein 4 isoform X2 [Humulus lupulus]|uniref:telomere repeat-binding protein 4 isoform X2 n=1 Tax=Humulus lupulus TaxID=3486 RepID=UPI002B41456D|nr:telomere repeat-binding protein 4 isoform X2 [Humulus lupulus]
MVLKKRLEYGFHGFQVPTIPRAPRSARRRGPNKKKTEDSQICAFELLASLAGKLLQESESSSACSNASEGNHRSYNEGVIKHERHAEDTLLKEACFDQGSSEESAFASEISSQDIDQKLLSKRFLHSERDAVSERTSNRSDLVEKVSDDMNTVIRNVMPTFHCCPPKVERGCPLSEESCHAHVETGSLSKANPCNSKDPMELQVEFPTTINLVNDVQLPSLREHVPNASFSRHRNDIKLVGRDDDENCSGHNKSSTKVKAFRPSARIGDRKIRKLLTSKYWKVAPKLRDCEGFRSDGGMKPLYNKRKSGYSRDRYQHNTFYKRRKLFDRSSVVLSDGGFSSESVSNSPEKGKSGDKNGFNGMLHGAGVSSSVISRQASFHSKDSHVKLSIKSFKIPELFIEVPETATIGSLKRTVMETVTAILGGGLHVGILLQGKKVKDDNKTLHQTGISCKDNLDGLGFTLEPNTMPVCPSMYTDDPLPSLSCDEPEPLRSMGTPLVDSVISDALLETTLPLTNIETLVESNPESVSCHSDSLTDNITSDSRALVVVPAISMEALAVVPANPKSKRSSELAQRRTRRPFSVSEVEALVQAVEELGTGRWRDVKLRAFEDADHRTYVDLKDKWKTLVHTARISPQQRRGEPVPQELLDRVLAAHAYWSQHQAKQQGKQQSGTLKSTDSPVDRNGVEGSHSS